MLLIMSILFSVCVSFSEGQSYILCDCLIKSACQCFIQRGDEGGAVKKIIRILIDKKYLPKGTPVGVFTVEVEYAVKQFQRDNDLDETGMMDDDTLTLLLWDMLPEEVDAKYGSFGESCKTVYIPTDGGKRRHISPKCSRMEDPRKVSVRNAEKLDFDPCGRCYK